ncbi:MAG TPA: VWA-like domain-containing protein [Candidatus Glassbacteria bacterium]|nr:VWA-like domain-containing protein [Candidatus Glassbacteria bacterium]
MHWKKEQLNQAEKNRLLADINHFRTLLMIDAPFTMPLMKFKIHFVDIPYIGGTNGFELFVCAQKWKPLTGPEKEGFLYHEWMHVVNLHSKRLCRRHPRMWNFATDFVINEHIMSDNQTAQITLPSGTLYDVKYRGWYSEKVYEDLQQKVDKIKNEISEGIFIGSNDEIKSFNGNNKKFCDSDKAAEILATEAFIEGLFSDDLIPPPENSASMEKDLIRDIVKAAEMHKKMKGSLPGNYEELIKKIKKSQVPWEQIFHSFFKEIVSSSNDRTFAKPKKWSWGYGIILPSEVGTRKLDVVLICDTSGSMANKDFEAFVGEVQKILPLIQNLTLISADVEVHEKIKIKNIKEIVGDNPSFRFRGRGGTSFVPALKVASKIRADMVIYFTDGFGDFGNKPREIKNMLWVLTNDECRKPPFGKYIVIN